MSYVNNFQDYIFKKLDNKNKLIKLYFKYQTFLAHISFYFLPYWFNWKYLYITID